MFENIFITVFDYHQPGPQLRWDNIKIPPQKSSMLNIPVWIQFIYIANFKIKDGDRIAQRIQHCVSGGNEYFLVEMTLRIAFYIQ